MLSTAAAMDSEKAWRQLTQDRRAAWEMLGWDEARWEGSSAPPVSEFFDWAELSTEEQSAAQYGLGYDEASWNAEEDEESLTSGAGVLVCDDDEPASSVAGRPASSSDAVGSPSDGGGAAAAAAEPGFFSSLMQAAAPMAKMALHDAARHNPALYAASAALHVAEDLHASQNAPVLAEGMRENLIYLDDSGSMGFGSSGLLEHGQHIARDVLPSLGGMTTRLVKFGSNKTVLSGRSSAPLTPSVLSLWDATSGGTYMWHMIEQDIMTNYRPGPGVLRVFVVTDGEDIESPYGYNGSEGMDPMQKALLETGYDIEWNIVLLQASDAWSSLSSGAADRYRDLCRATGGDFLLVEPPPSFLFGVLSDTHDTLGKHRTYKSWLKGVVRGSTRDEAEKKRSEKQREHRRAVDQGKATDFDWGHLLPPPK